MDRSCVRAENYNVQLSKALAYNMRYSPHLQKDDNGFFDLEAVMAELGEFAYADLLACVQNSRNKSNVNRFEMHEIGGLKKIRARPKHGRSHELGASYISQPEQETGSQLYFQPPTIVSCGTVVVRRSAAGELQALFIRRGDKPYLEFSKGRLEAGESQREAALRELREEAGLDLRGSVLDEDLVQMHTEGYPFQGAWKEVHYYTVFLPEPAPKFGSREQMTSEIVWISLADLTGGVYSFKGGSAAAVHMAFDRIPKQEAISDCPQCSTCFVRADVHEQKNRWPRCQCTEKKVDPYDGRAYTFEEFARYWLDVYLDDQVQAYWDNKCIAVSGSGVSAQAPSPKSTEMLWQQSSSQHWQRRYGPWQSYSCHT